MFICVECFYCYFWDRAAKDAQTLNLAELCFAEASLSELNTVFQMMNFRECSKSTLCTYIPGFRHRKSDLELTLAHAFPF